MPAAHLPTTTRHTAFIAYAEAPPHPGEVLREEILPGFGINLDELAHHLGLPPATLDALICEKAPVSLDIARQLGKAFGNGARYWLALQMHHDVWTAERRCEVEVAPLCAGRVTRKARLELRERPSMAMAVAAALGK